MLAFVSIAVSIRPEMRSGFAPAIEYVAGIVGGLIAATIAWIIVTLALKLLQRSLSQATRVVIGAMAATAFVFALATTFVFALATTLTFGTFLAGCIIAVPIIGAAAMLGGAIGCGYAHTFRRPSPSPGLSLACCCLARLRFGLRIRVSTRPRSLPGPVFRPNHVPLPIHASLTSQAALTIHASLPINAPLGDPRRVDDSALRDEFVPTNVPAPAADPSPPGTYGVSTLHYGSGMNRLLKVNESATKGNGTATKGPRGNRLL